VKSPKDAKDAEERQTARIEMNAPRVCAIRLRKPAEHRALSLCQDDFGPAFDELIDLIAAQMI